MTSLKGQVNGFGRRLLSLDSRIIASDKRIIRSDGRIDNIEDKRLIQLGDKLDELKERCDTSLEKTERDLAELRKT
jgi:hypothetical protein